MRKVGERYFYEGVWRPAGPIGFVKMTCLACGHRSASWDAFKAHRRACAGHMTRGPQPPPAPPPLSESDLDHLASLYDQLHDAEGAA